MSQKEHGKKQVKKAVCGICASGCPMDIYVEDGKIISVEGSKDLPGPVSYTHLDVYKRQVCDSSGKSI